MKKLIFILLMIPIICFAQKPAPKATKPAVVVDKQLFVEIKDTVTTAYHHKFTGKKFWDGTAMRNEAVADSIGLDSVRVMRMYFFANETLRQGKVYTQYVEAYFLGKRKGNDAPEPLKEKP